MLLKNKGKVKEILFDKTIENIILEEKLKQSGVIVYDKESWDLISGEYTGKPIKFIWIFSKEEQT